MSSRRRRRAAGYPGDLPPGIAGDATLAGWRDAGSGQFDEWSFDGGGREVPYLAYLEHDRNRLIEDLRETAQSELDQVSSDAREAAARLTETRAAEDAAIRAHETAAERVDQALVELDLHTGYHEPRPQHAAAAPRAAAQEAAPDPAGPPDGAAPDLAVPGHEIWPNQPAGPSGGTPAPDRIPRHWVGPRDGRMSATRNWIASRAAVPISRVVTLILVLMLATLEVPILFQAFRPFHPNRLDLVWAFTLPVALCTTLGPHLAGTWMRRRQAPPAGRLIPVGVTCVLLTWVTSVLLLADLRRRSLLIRPARPGQQLAIQRMDIDPTTITVLFSALLVLSGTIAFMLGYAGRHPLIADLRATDRALAEAEQARDAAVGARARAEEARLMLTGERVDSVVEQARRREAAVAEEYAAARAAYLGAVALRLGRPPVTQAVGLATASAPVAPWDPARPTTIDLRGETAGLQR